MAVYHNARGSVNYTIVGSPTIVDGVVSGFSNSNYLKTSSPLSVADNTPFDFYMTFTCISGNAGITAFVGSYDSLSFGYYDSAKKPIFRIRQANDTAYKQFTVNYTMSINNTYSIKAVYNGTNLVCYLYDGSSSLLQTETFNGENLNISSSAAFRIGSRQDGTPFSGSIDLNHTYITVNGQPWFGMCPIEVKKHQVMGPVGYTVVGSPTITDGVASDIVNLTNYVETSTTLPSTINSFEMVIKGKVSPETGRAGCCYSYKSGWYRYLGFQVYYKIKSVTSQAYWRYRPVQTSSDEDTGRIVVPVQDVHATSVSDFFWVKCTMQPAEDGKFLYSYYDSLDGQTWYLLGSQEDTYQMTGDDMSAITFINDPNYGASNRNSIDYLDLNETYIKVNGKLWFWQPQETKKIIVNGVEVYSKP